MTKSGTYEVHLVELKSQIKPNWNGYFLAFNCLLETFDALFAAIISCQESSCWYVFLIVYFTLYICEP